MKLYVEKGSLETILSFFLATNFRIYLASIENDVAYDDVKKKKYNNNNKVEKDIVRRLIHYKIIYRHIKRMIP